MYDTLILMCQSAYWQCWQCGFDRHLAAVISFSKHCMLAAAVGACQALTQSALVSIACLLLQWGPVMLLRKRAESSQTAWNLRAT